MQVVTIQAAARSEVGPHRSHNEDSYLARRPVFLVADGMGGRAAGEVASGAVIDAFRAVDEHEFTTPQAVQVAIADATDEVAKISAARSRGAGSTLTGVALISQGGMPSWFVFNIGDSRVYRLAGTSLEQLTHDHSLVQMLVDEGQMTPQQAAVSAQGNVITRALGTSSSTPDYWTRPVEHGERLLLCSDGLIDEVDDEAIRAALIMGGTTSSTVDALVEQAIEHGGRDNITAIVIDVVDGGQPAGGGSVGPFGMSRGPLRQIDRSNTVYRPADRLPADDTVEVEQISDTVQADELDRTVIADPLDEDTRVIDKGHGKGRHAR